MRVWIYPERVYAELGAKRFEAEWETVRPSAIGKEDIDHDADIVTHCQTFPTKDKAIAFARTKVESGVTMYGVVAVTEQRVDWFVEEDRIAEWVNVGDTEYVDAG